MKEERNLKTFLPVKSITHSNACGFRFQSSVKNVLVFETWNYTLCMYGISTRIRSVHAVNLYRLRHVLWLSNVISPPCHRCPFTTTPGTGIAQSCPNVFVTRPCSKLSRASGPTRPRPSIEIPCLPGLVRTGFSPCARASYTRLTCTRNKPKWKLDSVDKTVCHVWQ